MTAELVYVIVIATLVIIPVICFGMWMAVGRDPKFVKRLVTFPPEELNPAEAGYVMDGSIDAMDMSALIIYFAQKGYLEIIENDQHKFKLVRSSLPQTEKPSVVAYFNALFGGSNEVYPDNLPKDFNSEYSRAKEMMRSDFKGRNKIFSASSKAARTVASVITALIAGGIPFVTAYSEGSVVFMAIGAALLIVALVGVISLASAFNSRFTVGRDNVVVKTIVGIVLCLVAMASDFGIVSHMMGSYIWGFAIVASFIVSVIFTLLMKARTSRSASWLAHMLGMASFIKKNDARKLIELQQRNSQYFYSILPYAFVMEQSEKWMRSFKNIEVPCPDWFQVIEPDKFDIWIINGMLHSISDSISRRVSKMV